MAARKGGDKSVGVTVLGVFSVLLGAFFMVAGLWGLLQPSTIKGMMDAWKVPQLLNGFSAAWAYADAALNVVLAIMLFAAGIGLLRLRRWGASLAVAYALGRIPLSIVSFIMTLVGPISHRPTDEMLKTMPPTLADLYRTEFLPVALTMSIGSLLLSVVFAVILLCLLSRPSYREGLS